MTTKRTTQRLERYERRYRALANQLAGIGDIAQGSLAPRFTRCGKPTCACQGDPPKLHGPYWHWSAKVNGKTVNRRLSAREAELYTAWIDNDRRVRQLLTDMQRWRPKPPHCSSRNTRRRASRV